MKMKRGFICLFILVVAVSVSNGEETAQLRRSDDVSSLEVLVQTLAGKVTALEAKVQALENSQSKKHTA